MQRTLRCVDNEDHGVGAGEARHGGVGEIGRARRVYEGQARGGGLEGAHLAVERAALLPLLAFLVNALHAARCQFSAARCALVRAPMPLAP